MSDQEKPVSGSLVPAVGRDVASVVASNPLVSRGIADLAMLQESFATDASRHPFGTITSGTYRKAVKMFRLRQRIKELEEITRRAEDEKAKRSGIADTP